MDTTILPDDIDESVRISTGPDKSPLPLVKRTEPPLLPDPADTATLPPCTAPAPANMSTPPPATSLVPTDKLISPDAAPLESPVEIPTDPDDRVECPDEMIILPVSLPSDAETTRTSPLP